MKKLKTLILLGILGVIGLLIYFLTGFFVIQPIGAIPDGVTVWYRRYGTNLSFISSPDSISQDTLGYVSLFSRGNILGSIGEVVIENKIAKFSYSETLYIKSTGGSEYK